MKQYLSYSEMTLWNRDRAAYERRYVRGIDEPPNDRMKIGTLLHATIENQLFDWQKQAVAELRCSPQQLIVLRRAVDALSKKRPVKSEVTLMVELGDGVKLFAKMDGFDRENRELDEYKTTDKPDSWNQWRVDHDDQLSFYALVFHRLTRQYLRDVRLHRVDLETFWESKVNTAKGTVKTFKTARGPSDLEKIEGAIWKTVKEMQAAGIWTKRLSRSDRDRMSQGSML